MTVSVPLNSGIRGTESGDFAVTLPVNLELIPTETGLGKAYARTAMGATLFTTGPDKDRGGIVWNGLHHRVMGTSLVSITETGLVTILADVGGSGPVTMDYGFGRLAIRSGEKLYYWDGLALTQVTDPDLGPVKDVLWMAGYYVTTDGQSIVVTDLANPLNINPLKYGSAEADPDQIVGLGRLRDELLAFGSNTIEFYTNQGGSGFPFVVNQGATISVGCVGPQAKCPFVQTYAFVGAGRNQGVGAWLVAGGSATKISTRAIDDMLAAEPNQPGIQMEARVSRDEHRLYIHLSDRTLVYLASASAQGGEAVWYVAKSGTQNQKPYRLRNAVLVGSRWFVGDTESNAIGLLSEQIDPGNGREVFFSFTKDGQTWSQEKSLAQPDLGARARRTQWRPHLRFSGSFVGLRFRGTNGQPQFGDVAGWSLDSIFFSNKGQGGIIHDVELMGMAGRKGYSIASCEARVEPLSV